MDYNHIDVMIWNCKAIGKARNERELIATRHYKIPAGIVRENEAVINDPDRKVFDAFINDYIKNGTDKLSSSKRMKRIEDKKMTRSTVEGDGEANPSTDQQGDEKSDLEGQIVKDLKANDELPDYSELIKIDNVRIIKEKLRAAGIGHAQFMKPLQAIQKAEEMGIL